MKKKSAFMLKRNEGIRYEVCGEVLEGKDLQTLIGSSCLNDKVMNAYMEILTNEQNLERNGPIFIIPSYMAVLWENKNFDTWFYEKVKMSMYTWLFMPVNKNHWILLAANVPKMTVSIVDSMTGTNDKYIFNYWRIYMKKRSEVVGELHGEWVQEHIKSGRQRDVDSCGPFVLMNALALSKGVEPCQLSQKYATVMRLYVSNKIITSAKKPKSQRTICDMLHCQKPAGKNVDWVQCEVCGRWLHNICLDIKEVPKNEYVCIVCHAQYQ